MEVLVLISIFLVLLALRMPVCFTMIVTSVIFMWFNDLPLLRLSLRIADGVDSFPLLAIPLFIFAGNLMNTMGVTQRIFDFAGVLVRHITGGLGHVNVLASIIFAGMSGSAMADAGGLGVVELKAMRKAGYAPEFSAAITAASATVGPVIPPSIVMIIYAFIVEESVGRLFLAGVIPGLLMGLSMMTLIYVFAKLKIYRCPLQPRASLGEIWIAFRRALLPLMAPVILVGGILSGAFTPTEAGVVVVVYVLLMGAFYLSFNLGHIHQAMLETVRLTAMTLYIVAASMVFAWIIVILQVPEKATAMVSAYLDSPVAVLAFIVAMLLLLGAVLEVVPVLIIAVPTFMVLAANFGIDPIHLGVVSVIAVMIGVITPPVGLTLYVVMSIANMPMQTLVKAIWPFYFALLLVVVLVVIFPNLALWLPDLAFGDQ